VVARGDRRVSDLIFQAWKNGARFDGWDECFDIQRWIDAASELNIDLNTYLDEIPEMQELPWSVVSTGVSESFLMEERRRALLGMTTEDCRTGKCTSCGVCVNGIRREIPDEKSFILYSGSRNSATQKKETRLFQYRFLYRKGEQVRYLGHLDMVSVIQRAFLAAGVPVAFSNGFNPHPRMSFGPPLPSGIIGECEAFDVVMTGKLSSDSLIVNKWLPDDLKVIGFRELPERSPSLNSSISSALYRFTPYQEMEEGDIKERIGRLLSLDAAEVEIKKGGEVRCKNIRPGIIELKSTEGGFEALLSMVSTNSCKPSELIKGLFPQMEPADFTIVREQCFSGGEPVGWQV
jgi:radical SAM-linked protein